MTIGTAESPFLNRVTITLTGRRRDIPLVLTRGLILGSKAIGVFGNVCTLTITQNTHFGCFVSQITMMQWYMNHQKHVST